MSESDTNPKDLIGITKPPLDLVPPALLLYTSKVMALGAAKYGAYNWRNKKVKYSIYIAAAMRHLLAVLDGESEDPESGMPHMAHVASCCAIVLDAQVTGNLIDDRPKRGKAAELTRWLTKSQREPSTMQRHWDCRNDPDEIHCYCSVVECLFVCPSCRWCCDLAKPRVIK